MPSPVTALAQHRAPRSDGECATSSWHHLGVRKLRVAPEYGTGSIWDDDWDGERDIAPSLASLGVSPELQADFEAWEQIWQATFVADDPPRSGFATDEDRIAFNVAGEQLTARLRRELGPDTAIRYVPREPNREPRSTTTPRSLSERLRPPSAASVVRSLAALPWTGARWLLPLREDRRLDGIRLRVDLEPTIEDPTVAEIERQVHRLGNDTMMLTLERLDPDDGSYIACGHSRVGWYLNRRGTAPTDVAQSTPMPANTARDMLVRWCDGKTHADDRHFTAGDPQPLNFPATTADRRVRSYWDEEDITFFYEVDRDGIVLRAVELIGPDQRPQAAASRAEFLERQEHLGQPETPRTWRQRLRYGSVPEGSMHEADPSEFTDLTADEFEALWTQARAYLTEHPRGWGAP